MPIGTQTVTDDFNRANSDPMSGNWTCEAANSFKIVSNAVVMGTFAGADSTAVYNTWASGNDQYSQTDITVVGTGAGTGLGVVVRRNTTIGTQTLYWAVMNASGTITIARFVTGSFTSITTRSVTYSAGKKLGLAIQGTTLKVWYDGVQQGADITDANIASGSPGLAYSSASTSGTIDNWDAGTTGTSANTKSMFFSL